MKRQEIWRWDQCELLGLHLSGIRLYSIIFTRSENRTSQQQLEDVEKTCALGIRCAASPGPIPKRPAINDCEFCGLSFQDLSFKLSASSQ